MSSQQDQIYANRDALLQKYAGQYDPTLQSYLTQYSDPGTLSTADLLKRYQAISGAPEELGNFVQGSYNYNPKAFGADSTNLASYKAIKDGLGRDPTQDEFAQLLQAFQGPNGMVNGRAAVSQYGSTIKNDPTNINSPLNPQNPGYQDTLKPHNDAVAQQFQSILGRAPTADELQHFSAILASGQTDVYGLQNFLKQQPEYTNAQDAQFRQGLNTELQDYDTAEFDREKGSVMSDYAARGFSPGNSPSLDYALTDLMGQIAKNRQGYLAQLSAQQYGGNKNVAIGNYQNSLNQMYDQSNQNRQRQQQMSDYYTQRGNQGADYQTQMNDYLNFMRSNKGNSGNPLYGAIGGAVGATAGAVMGGPAGAGAGYQVGSGLGNSFGYLNS